MSAPISVRNETEWICERARVKQCAQPLSVHSICGERCRLLTGHRIQQLSDQPAVAVVRCQDGRVAAGGLVGHRDTSFFQQVTHTLQIAVLSGDTQETHLRQRT